MNNKPEIIFTLPACMGGVASFNHNIINNSLLIKNFYSKVILIKADEDQRPLFHDEFQANEVIPFSFSYKENQYYVQKRLNKLLGNDNGCVVTDNMLTINAAHFFKNRKTLFHLIHDYFYVNQNIQAGDSVDVAIAHSSFFSDAVFASNPKLFFNRSFYIPYGVQQIPAFPEKNNAKLNLVFLGRLEEEKGVMILNEINEGLKTNNVEVNWSIIGKGGLKKRLLEQWGADQNVTFFEPDSTEKVYEILKKQDLFIFPCSFEGTPVSILECIANGVVPITNDLPGGIRDIVKEGIGHRCELNNTDQFINFILKYHSNRQELQEKQKNCYEFSSASYDIKKNADNYFKKFLEYGSLKRNNKNSLVKMSRLDNPIFPNAIVKFIRNIR